MICPSCGYDNLPGHDECAECQASLMQEDQPQPDTPLRRQVMVDPISTLEASSVELQTAPTGTSLSEAIRKMQEKNVGYLLITDPQGKLAGIFTERDVLDRIAGQIEDLAAYRVDAFMTPNPTTLSASEPIRHALHFMGLDDLTYIPLVDDEGRPQDLLSVRRVTRLIEQME